MLENGFYAVAGVMALAAIANWRLGIYLALLVDVARDPIRKLSESQSVWITVGGAAVWGGVFLGAMTRESWRMRQIAVWYPRIKTALQCLVLALIPGVIISLTYYAGGYKLVAVGLVSYLAPLIGVAIGFVIPRDERDVDRILRFYTFVNAIALIGTIAEYQGIEHRVLAGIGADWLRTRDGYAVNLISGIYRSPDIMGLHAAHVVIFSIILGMRSREAGKTGWPLVACWGIICLLLSGRRKMLGIPLVFAASYIVLNLRRGGSRGTFALMAVVAVVAIVGAVVLGTQSDEAIEGEYTQYSATLFEEGLERSLSVEQSIFTTLNQSGIFGSGIGSATQGAGYTGIERQKAWQEDGASRLFKELGLPGAFLVSISLVLLARTVVDSMKSIPSAHPAALLQASMVSIIIANGASFVISHQHYSGDPGSALLVVLMLGMTLAMPRIYAQQLREAISMRRVFRQSPRATRNMIV